MAHTSATVDRYAQEQQILAKQVEATGQAVACMTLDMMSDSDLDDQYVIFGPGVHHRSSRPPTGEPSHRRVPPRAPRPHHDAAPLPRSVLPKLQFPLFTGENPKIWRDKCVDYFRISNIEESMWVTAAALHFDKNAAKWLQVYKKTNPDPTWEQFADAVESIWSI